MRITILALSTAAMLNGQTMHSAPGPKGKLFIIGGGDKSPAMMKELVRLAGFGPRDYIVALPMASEMPDSSVIWTREDFQDTGAPEVIGFNFTGKENMTPARLDSVRHAKLIFIGGGDQLRFMQVVQNTPLYAAIHEAYNNGAIIAGTSAGAAVMTAKMLTGNQKRHLVYTGAFTTIEEGNIELAEGLGLLRGAIIDQHFIKRQRLNRLLSVAIENPSELCIGIDESTAILVEGGQARVLGESQVIVIRNTRKTHAAKNGLLGVQGLSLDIYLPGESFSLVQGKN